MPLDISAMKTAIETKLVAASPMSNASELAQAIAEALVPYLVANVVVVPTLLIAPGGMAPAPVTGTGTIT